MIEPVLRTQETDTTKYNDFLSSNSNQKNSLDTEQSLQQIAKQKENSNQKNETTAAKNENVLNEESAQENTVGFSNMGERLREMTGITQVYFQFELCDEKRNLIMKILDVESHEVLQQYPSDLSLKIAQMIEEHLGRGQIANATI